MNILKSIIRIYEIKNEMEADVLHYSNRPTLIEEFDSLKVTILNSNFAFDNVRQLITEVESKIRS